MSKSIKTEIIINASKEKVWDILTNFAAYPQWNPFIVQVEGQAVAGTRLRNTMLNGEQKMVFTPQVLKVDKYRYFDWLGSLWVKGLFDGHHQFEIEEVSANQVILKHRESFSGIFSGMVLKKIGDDTRNNFVRMNQALKNLAESRVEVIA